MSWEIDRSAIGEWGPETTMRVEYGKIREFARAIKEDGAAFAGEAPLAPPTFLMTIAHWGEGAASGGVRAVKLDMRRLLHGEQEFEYLKPIRAGDVLRVRSTHQGRLREAGLARREDAVRADGERVSRPA